jgi:holo-[acyl-carrier protein] synthase
MVVGIGTDLIEIDRVIKACDKNTFINKYFTDNEIKLAAQNSKIYADNFAVKESVAKMLGTGFREIVPIEIEVLRDSLGKPYVNLYGEAFRLSRDLGITKIFVSITNTKKYASAFVVGEGE